MVMRLINLFQELLGSFVLAAFGTVIGLFGLVMIAIPLLDSELSLWSGSPMLGQAIGKYGIPAILFLAGAATLLQAAFFPAAYPAAYRHTCPIGEKSPSPFIDGIRRYLCHLWIVSMRLLLLGLVSLLGVGAIVALGQCEVLGWAWVRILAFGWMIVVCALLLWCVMDMIRIAIEFDNANKTGKAE